MARDQILSGGINFLFITMLHPAWSEGWGGGHLTACIMGHKVLKIILFYV